MKTVEHNVAMLLNTHTQLCNDDNALIFAYWTEYDGYAPTKPYKAMTPAMSIIRARQKLQAHGYYLPTSEKVKTQRRKRETEMKHYALN